MSRDLQGRKLGLLLSTGPDRPDLDICVGLASAARDAGVEVYVYLLDDGVRHMSDHRIRELGRRGARLFACAYGCQRRRLPVADEVTPCGLVVLTDLLDGTDRFVAFT